MSQVIVYALLESEILLRPRRLHERLRRVRDRNRSVLRLARGRRSLQVRRMVRLVGVLFDLALPNVL